MDYILEIINYKSNESNIDRHLTYDDLFKYTPANIKLLASQTKLFSLSIIPKNNILCGSNIKIIGIRWQIFDCMQGFYKFENAFREMSLLSPLSKCSFLKYGKKSIESIFENDNLAILTFVANDDTSMGNSKSKY